MENAKFFVKKIVYIHVRHEELFMAFHYPLGEYERKSSAVIAGIADSPARRELSQVASNIDGMLKFSDKFKSLKSWVNTPAKEGREHLA